MNTLHLLVKSVLVVEIIFATSVHSSQNKNNILRDDISFCGTIMDKISCVHNNENNDLSDDENIEQVMDDCKGNNTFKNMINSSEENDNDEEEENEYERKSVCRSESSESNEEIEKVDSLNNEVKNTKIDKRHEKRKDIELEIKEIELEIKEIELEIKEIDEYECELLLDRDSLKKQLKEKQLEKKILEERKINVQIEIINLLNMLNDIKSSEKNSDKQTNLCESTSSCNQTSLCDQTNSYNQTSSCNQTDLLGQIIGEMELKIINLLNMFINNKINNQVSVKDDLENNLKSKISDKDNLSNQIRYKLFEIYELDKQIQNNQLDIKNLNELKKNLENRLNTKLLGKNIIDNQLKNKRTDIYAMRNFYN